MNDKALVASTPTKRLPSNPGAYVQANASMSSNFIFAFSKHSSITIVIFSKCRRLATSGTTPPYLV